MKSKISLHAQKYKAKKKEIINFLHFYELEIEKSQSVHDKQ